MKKNYFYNAILALSIVLLVLAMLFIFVFGLWYYDQDNQIIIISGLSSLVSLSFYFFTNNQNYHGIDIYWCVIILLVTVIILFFSTVLLGFFHFRKKRKKIKIFFYLLNFFLLVVVIINVMLILIAYILATRTILLEYNISLLTIGYLLFFGLVIPIAMLILMCHKRMLTMVFKLNK